MNVSPKNINDLPDDIRPTVNMIDSMFDEIYLVGGAVRDILMGNTTLDLDFAVPNSVNDIERILSSNKLLKVHIEGKKFGTIAANIGHFDIQVTSYRSEEYLSGSRKPIINQSVDIDSDLSRRDFSVNAIALSREEFVDPYDGIGDIERKIIRCVGDADVKFKEDPLRILRAFRFVAIYGFEVEERTLNAATENKNNLQIVSSERQGEELKKLLSGKYWADALNEMSDAGVLNELLRSFEFTYEISDDDMRHEFEKYSAAELEAMDLVKRWAYLINIMAYAEQAAGITSTDISALAETILNKAQVPKQIKGIVLDTINANVSLDKLPTLEDQLGSIKRQVAVLKANNDPKHLIEEAKYYTLEGQAALKEVQYNTARMSFKMAVEVTEKNYEFILKFRDEEKRKSKLRGITPYYKRRLQYYLSAVVLDDKLYAKYKSSNALALFLKKELKRRYIGNDDIRSITDAAVAYVYRKNIHGVTLESYYDFLNKPDLALEPETRRRYLSQYIETEIRSRATPPKEKAKMYLEKAKLSVTNKNEDEYGLEYYDPYIDHLFNKMLYQDNLEKFNKTYDDFELAIHKYINITRREMKPWMGNRKYRLTSASALIHALTLADTIDEKLDIVRRIVADYSNVGHGFDKNIQRYRVYQDWFGFVKNLLSSTYSNASVDGLIANLQSSKSRKYIDIDEDYLHTERPDIVHRRDLLQECYQLLVALNIKKGNKKFDFLNPTIGSIYNLLINGVLDQNSAFTLLKNYVSKDENQNIHIENTAISDRELKSKEYSEVEEYLNGESETVEYKSSWEFDVKRYSATGEKQINKELAWEVVKNIAGIANKKGGTLLIGVDDDATVCGLEETDFMLGDHRNYLKKLDNLQRKIRNEILNKLDQEVLARISIESLKYNNKTILRIKIPPARNNIPVIYRDGEQEVYYVRSGTSTDNAGMRALMDRISSDPQSKDINN